MIVPTNAVRFRLPDGGLLFVELRRHHDTGSYRRNKEFIVSKRFLPPREDGFGGRFKFFGTWREGKQYWDGQVKLLEDAGLQRFNPVFAGFHEEG